MTDRVPSQLVTQFALRAAKFCGVAVFAILATLAIEAMIGTAQAYLSFISALCLGLGGIIISLAGILIQEHRNRMALGADRLPKFPYVIYGAIFFGMALTAIACLGLLTESRHVW